MNLEKTQQWISSEILRLQGKPPTDSRTVQAWLTVSLVLAIVAPNDEKSEKVLEVIEDLIRSSRGSSRVTARMLRSAKAKAHSVLGVASNG
tara:strand:- start:961 stop:1233 length:273 start_codon:yes stop_codon:yes gene_type:complete